MGNRKPGASHTSTVAGSAALLLMTCLACDQMPERTANSPSAIARAACVMPTRVTTVLDRDGAVLEMWSLRLEDVATDALPTDSAFLAFRAAIEKDEANVRHPAADPPVTRSAAEARIWHDEQRNNDVVLAGSVGSIDSITCLDALLFARQASRLSPIDRPTEFLASVLTRTTSTGTDLVVVFGAGPETFPPKSVYGLDVVRRHLAEGWRFWYMIHNHTVRRHGQRLALGIPAPSTSDVSFYRSLGSEMGMDSLRVTNGFYTFRASVEELRMLRGR